MTWMIFLALIAIVTVMALAAARGLEVDRITGARLLASSFFLVLAFVGLGTASFLNPPEIQFQGRMPMNDQELFSGNGLAILGIIAGGIGLFLLALGAVHFAQSQWRQRLDKFDEPEMSRLDESDLNEPRDDR